MIDDLPWHRQTSPAARWLAKNVPNRHFIIGTEKGTRVFRIGRRLQIGTAAIFAATLLWVAFSSGSYVIDQHSLRQKSDEIARVREAHASLLEELERYREEIAQTTEGLDRSETAARALFRQNAKLKESLKTVLDELASTQAERDGLHASRYRLDRQLAHLEERIRQLFGESGATRSTDGGTVDLADSAEPEASRASRIVRLLLDLERQVADLQVSRQAIMARIRDGATLRTESLERLVSQIGLDADSLLFKADGHREPGLGGPFVEATAAARAVGRTGAEFARLDAELTRWEALQGLIQRLPLAPPLDAFAINSSFGNRRDPINGRWASHEGVDMDAPFGSPVYAPAPGIVVVAGPTGKYGRLVEINHGYGIRTRYGHLSEILVKRGQRIRLGDKIGLLGSSGRSTGPHLHYEVRYQGKAKDPMTFIRAGRNVFQE
jgi:murein DD-endopeptidase MepM/ murein hydrolase activator NlpD